MKCNKQSILTCVNTYMSMLQDAEVMWGKLRELDQRKHEYFKSVDSLDFEDVESRGLVSVTGWDGSGICMTEIPIEYFYREDWYEIAKNEFEEEERRKRIAEEKTKELIAEVKEKQEREEYERLKKKFESH